MSSGDTILSPETSKIKVNEMIMLCANSQTNEITVIRDSSTLTATFNAYDDVNRWYVSLDGGYLATSSNKSIIELNTGITAFVHQMPEGYSAWSSEVDEFLGLSKKQSCSHCFIPISSILFYVLTLK